MFKAINAKSAHKSVKPVQCPVCCDRMGRVGRKVVQRALRFSKRYYCEACHKTYLKWLGKLVRDGVY